MRSSAKQFFLDSRFRVECVTEGDWDGFRYRISASRGTLISPPIRVDSFLWFEMLYRQTAGFSTGFQVVLDPTILAGLATTLGSVQSIETGSPSRMKPT